MAQPSSRRQGQRTHVPTAVLRAGREDHLDVYAKAVYGVLLSYADRAGLCWPGQERIARETPCSVAHVRTALRALEAADLVTTIPNPTPGAGNSNAYVVRRPASLPRVSESQHPLRPGGRMRYDVPPNKYHPTTYLRTHHNGTKRTLTAPCDCTVDRPCAAHLEEPPF